MAQAFANSRDRGKNLERQPYGVGIGAEYDDYITELKMQMSLVAGDERSTSADGASLVTENDKNCKYQYDAPTVSDSSIFGNDVLNPYAGFCRDDDIVHASYRGDNHTYGMGRVYQEIYDSKQQILYMQFGIPKYRNLRTYLANAANSDMAELNDSGSPGLVSKLKSLVVGGIVTAIKLPFLPLEFGYNLIKGLDETKVTEYFYFKETMMLYYRYVNTIMSHLAVSMGLFGTDVENKNLPEILQGGPDIFTILSTRSRRYTVKAGTKIPNSTATTDDLLEGSLQEDPPTEGEGVLDTLGKWWDKFWGKIWGGTTTSVLDSNKFIAFRIEKGSDNASETFSNTTQESSLQQRLNGMVSQQREANLSAETSGNDALSWINRQYQKASTLLNSTYKAFSGGNVAAGVQSVIAYMAAGNGYFDLPQQWAGSNFSRSVSISIRLRAKTGGDPVSIYTSIMIPLSCLLAAAMPRQAGDGTYTSPFICRAWCRGMFAVPAGIIQSLSVSRGDSEFGWSLTRLPTTVSVSIQIADLSPIMFMGLAGEGAWKQAFANNTKLHEYLNTLSGLGLKQRYYQFQQIKRNAQAWALIQKNTTLSATYWGMRLGDSSVGRIVNLFTSVKAMRVGSN